MQMVRSKSHWSANDPARCAATVLQCLITILWRFMTWCGDGEVGACSYGFLLMCARGCVWGCVCVGVCVGGWADEINDS